MDVGAGTGRGVHASGSDEVDPVPTVRPGGRFGAAGSVLDRPLVGWSLMAIAALHTAAAPVVYPDSVRSTWHAGVVGAVERDRSLIALRGVGFWYVTAGLGTGLLGAIVRWGEVRSAGVPRWFGWGLVAFTAWGAALMPRSGFWAFAVPALLALRRRRPSTGSWPAAADCDVSRPAHRSPRSPDR